VTKGDEAFLLGYAGNLIETPPAKKLRIVDDKHFIATLKNDKVTLLNRRGKVIIDKEYDELKYNGHHKMFHFKDGEMAGLLNMNGTEIISYACEILSPFYMKRRSSSQ